MCLQAREASAKAEAKVEFDKQLDEERAKWQHDADKVRRAGIWRMLRFCCTLTLPRGRSPKAAADEKKRGEVAKKKVRAGGASGHPFAMSPYR